MAMARMKVRKLTKIGDLFRYNSATKYDQLTRDLNSTVLHDHYRALHQLVIDKANSIVSRDGLNQRCLTTYDAFVSGYYLPYSFYVLIPDLPLYCDKFNTESIRLFEEWVDCRISRPDDALLSMINAGRSELQQLHNDHPLFTHAELSCMVEHAPCLDLIMHKDINLGLARFRPRPRPAILDSIPNLIAVLSACRSMGIKKEE